MRHRGMALVLSTAMCLGASGSARPCAQGACANQPSGGGQSAEGFVQKSDGSCSAAPNGYVKIGTTYRLDAAATAFGECQIRLYECTALPLSCSCNDKDIQLRGTQGVAIAEYNASAFSPLSVGPIYPKKPGTTSGTEIRQAMDSRISGTTIPDGRNWTPWTEGAVTLAFRNIIYTTSCNILPSDVSSEVPLKAVRCIPQFQRLTSGSLVHLTPSTIEVYIPPTGMLAKTRAGIQWAIDEWNGALAAYPGTPQFHEASQPCTPGPLCVTTKEDNIPVTSDCAQGALSATPDGTIVSATITFPSAAAPWSPEFLKRLAAHELGHALGLKENDSSCPTAESLMRPVSCTATAGFPTQPTVSDHLAVGSSVYGGETTDTCPAK
jgi:hypothetical protein